MAVPKVVRANLRPANLDFRPIATTFSLCLQWIAVILGTLHLGKEDRSFQKSINCPLTGNENHHSYIASAYCATLTALPRKSQSTDEQNHPHRSSTVCSISCFANLIPRLRTIAPVSAFCYGFVKETTGVDDSPPTTAIPSELNTRRQSVVIKVSGP